MMKLGILAVVLVVVQAFAWPIGDPPAWGFMKCVLGGKPPVECSAP